MSKRAMILVVEDKESEREALARVLRLEDYDVVTAHNPEQAIGQIENAVDLVISDLRMGESSGIDLLRYWSSRRPGTPFIMVTAFGDVESAVEAMKLGAEDYLSKPINPDELLILVKKCIEARRKDDTIAHLQERLDERFGFERVVGNHRSVLQLFEQARRAAKVDSTVLITGESGTGKELIAAAVHQNSPRRTGSFVTINMAAVPEHLVESELFGHVKGAFTGATSPRIGRFEAADGGTLFIDEIGDFALASQAKLLRVLENRTVTPIGSNNDTQVDVRVVAATSRDLEQMVQDGDFREDLYYRLNVVSLRLPPLRERREDIPLLIDHFIRELCAASERPPIKVDSELMRFLETYEWPGNVRQLKNTLESMVVLATGDSLTMRDLPATLDNMSSDGADVDIPAGTTLEELERAAVEQTLADCGGNRTRAARSLGISVRTLQRKLKAWGLGESSNGE
ncbi:MAG: sigma-54 dependent transcriptional regulator [Pirellulaceae bacterium]